MTSFRLSPLVYSVLLFGAWMPAPAYSQTSELSPEAKKQLARDFVSSIKAGFQKADEYMRLRGVESDAVDLRGLQEGEPLIFQVRIPPNLKVEGSVLGEVGSNTVLVSLLDFIQVLGFPITRDKDGVYGGWFIRENKTFRFDPKLGSITADGKDFTPSPGVIVNDDDVLVPVADLKHWFSMDIDIDVATQVLALDPEFPLPATERLERRDGKNKRFKLAPPELPRGDDEYELLDFPSIDVSTRTNLSAPAEQERDVTQQVNIRTAGEFAYGTLNTNLSADDTNKLTNARVSYLRESAYPELLGPLKARRFELGDVQTTRQPLTGGAPPETGLRITNADPLLRQTLPSTQIAGYIFPGWDVELYRDNSLVSFQETTEEGYYSFDDVQLYPSRNVFRVVAYGPQGEVVEETINVPYDRERLARGGGVYDVSLTMQDQQFYTKYKSPSEDEATPHLSAFYEQAVSDSSAVRVGVRARQEEGIQKTYGSLGLSTTAAGALINTTVAADEQGEMGSELVASRLFGQHRGRATLNLNTEGYNPGQSNTSPKVFVNRYNIEGPLGLGIGDRPRYAASAAYSENALGMKSFGGFLNLNTQFKNIGLNQILNYNDASSSPGTLRESDAAGPTVNTISSVTGSFGRNTLRGLVNYNVEPDKQVESLTASWRRRIDKDFETQLQVDQRVTDSLTTYSAQVNWRPDFATISPRVSYDSEGNIEGLLSTSFGINRLPQTGEFVFNNSSYTGSGIINAFVFLDKDGNGKFDGEDEPIPDAKVSTPQNANGAKTNAEGVANITQLRPNILTDVLLDQGTLSDPYWIPAQKGVSILPRTGTNVSLEFPVHMAGEMDGTVYAKGAGGSSKTLRGATLRLYDLQGNVVQSTTTGPDGFYIFSLIPPGQYALLIDTKSIPADIARPPPRALTIGYEGTILYGNDVILDAGTKDIPSEILTSLEDYKALHPHVEFPPDPDVLLNFGEFNSSLMMALTWYHLSTRYEPALRGTQLLVTPAESFPDTKTGMHQLRATLPHATMSDAYEKCRALVSRGIYCKVEILPGALAKLTPDIHPAEVASVRSTPPE